MTLETKDILESFTNGSYVNNILDDFYVEGTNDHITSKYVVNQIYPSVEKVLSTPVGDRKFKQLVGNFLDKNNERLHTPGPQYSIAFGEYDQKLFYNLFNLNPVVDIDPVIKKVIAQTNHNSEFKLLTRFPNYWMMFCVIRFYAIKKDEQGINSALIIYSLMNYPLTFSTFFKYEPDPAIMKYTMDHLSKKFTVKKAGNLIGALLISMQSSFSTLKDAIIVGYDRDVIRYIQRIRNDQKSMLKYIADQFYKNEADGLRIKKTMASASDDIQFDDTATNNTAEVEKVADNIMLQIITNGIDLRRIRQAKDLGGISMNDCRLYMSKILVDSNEDSIRKFIHSIVFLYLYGEKKTKEDINSSGFLIWSGELFRKTNSNDPNISNIKDTLTKWSIDAGIYTKFKREATRINYKKAIFWYFIFSIQYYNK